VGTYFPHKGDIKEQWYTIDAEGQVLGRVATRVASILRGKERATFTPFLDNGDHVIILNAAKIVLTGEKLNKKLYHHYTGYPGGLRTVAAEKLIVDKPEQVLRIAIEGMLPKSKLGKAMARKLMIYADNQHPHVAQQPQTIGLGK
jgi:large subunit ribosomal protein L13